MRFRLAGRQVSSGLARSAGEGSRPSDGCSEEKTLSEATGASTPAPADGSNPDGAGGSRADTFLSHRQIMILLPGLLMTMLLAMLDQLVVEIGRASCRE